MSTLSCELDDILIDTHTLVLSEKLYTLYINKKDILVSDAVINNFIAMSGLEVRKSLTIGEDFIVCFNEELKALGIIKTGKQGYAMSITENSPSLISTTGVCVTNERLLL